MASPYALDFSPLSQAIQNNQQLDLARNKLAMEQERLGFERDLQPFKIQTAQQQVDTGKLEYEKGLATRFGGLATSIQDRLKANPNDPSAIADWQKLYSHPLFNKHFSASPFGYSPTDAANGARMLALEAQGWQDPEQQKLVLAHARQLEAEANKAGYVNLAPGTNLVSIAPQGTGAPPPGRAAAVGQGSQPLPATPPTADVNARLGQAQPAAPQQGGTPAPGTIIASAPLKPPPGYEPDPGNPGGYRPQVGGPADIKFTEAKNKALFSVQSSAAKIDDLVQNITELQSHPGLKGNFGLSGALPNFPGSQSSDAFSKLQQLKSQGGFAMLQAMRDASKTGGALGNVSDAEGARLEAAFGALQRASSLPQAMRELEKIKAQALRSKGFLIDAYNRQYNAETIPAQTPTRSAPETTTGSSAALKRVQSDADYERLNQGERFIGPDGRVRVKP